MPTNRSANEFASGHRDAVRMDHNDILHEEDGHSIQFWDHRGAGLHRGNGDRGSNFLSIYNRKYQAVWRTQSDGCRQLVAHGHDPVTSLAGEHDRLWLGHWRRYVVWKTGHVARLAVGVLHAVGGVYRDR